MDWNDLYKKNAPKLIGVCRRYVKENSIAEDLVQDAFIKMYEHISSYKGKGTIENWMKKIAINEALQFIRSNKKIKISFGEPEDIPEPLENVNNSEIELLLEENNFSETILLEALDSIPEYYRIVFNLYSMEGYSHKEIAEQLNIPIGTSKSYLNRAREQLKKILIDYLKQKEKKKNIVYASFIMILPKDAHPIDSIFKKKLENLSIEPVKHLKFSPKNSSHKISLRSFISKKMFLIMGTSIIGVGIIWYNTVLKGTKKEEQVPIKSIVEYKPVGENNISSMPEKIEVQISLDQKNQKEASAHPPIIKDVDTLGVKPAPVVVHKKIIKKELIVKKDTVVYEN